MAGVPETVPHTLVLDRATSDRLAHRARARSAHEGFLITKADLVREAVREHFRNHPDSEYFVDALPGQVET